MKTEASTENQPCPWCKSTDIRVHKREVGWKHNEGTIAVPVAYCADCGAQGPPFGPFSIRSEKTALRYWNHRLEQPPTFEESL